MQVFDFLTINVDICIISGNFRVKFLIETFIQFPIDGNWIQIHTPFPFLTFWLISPVSKQFRPCYTQHNLFITFIGNMKF